MNDNNEITPQPHQSPPRYFFLLIAFLPTLIILSAFEAGQGRSNPNSMNWVIFVVNPLIAIFACMLVFVRQGADRFGSILRGFFLGLTIAVINGCVGCVGALRNI